MKAILFVLSLLVIASCNNREALESVALNAPKAIYSNLAVAEVESGELADMDPLPMNVSQTTVTQPAPSRMLIKDGSLRFKTDDLKKTKSAISQVVQSHHAYSSSENMTDDDHSISFHQVIRVPADRFEELIQKIELLADTLDEQTIESRDVTEEFIDVEARVKTKREVEKRYLELLKQAKKVDDMLAIEQKAGEIRTEIESMEGKLKYLRNQVAYSTITLDYYQVIETPFGFGPRMASSFSIGWENLLSFLIGISSLWPVVIFISIGIWLIKRWWSKKHAPATQADAA